MDLGLIVNVENPQYAELVFRRAKDSGFDFGQVSITWQPITTHVVTDIIAAANKVGFRIRSVFCLTNLLALNESMDAEDAVGLAINHELLSDCRSLCMWSGTHAKSWTEPNLINQGDDTFYELVGGVHKLMAAANDSQWPLLLQPCHAHVLHDIASSLKLAEEFQRSKVSICFDPAYLIGPNVYVKRGQVLPRLIDALAPSADIICIRDMIVDESGVTRHVLPGKGALDMTGMIGALKKNAPADALWMLRPPPLVNTEELIEAREYVQDLLAREDAGAASV